MSVKWYGNLSNRLDENKMFTKTIEVGTGMTEYMWSDRRAYEVVEVIDQKHVKVREYTAKHIGEAYENNWELLSDENNPVCLMTKRGKYWYWTVEITSDILDEIENCKDANRKFELSLFLAHNEVDTEKLRKKGKITRYHRANVSFGIADYYYDYEF